MVEENSGELSPAEPPVVVAPISDWNIVTERALRFGLQLPPT